MSPKTSRYIVMGISMSAVGLLGALAMLSMLKILKFGSPIDFGILALLTFCGPFPFYEHMKVRRIEKIEDRLSDFLRDLAESGRFGMTLADSIRKASKGNYGKLTPEIRKMATQVDWGVPATDALERFARRVNTPLVNRAVAIVIKSSKAGGDVSDVLTVTAGNIKDLQQINEGRKMEMGSYKAVIFVAFAVFLATVVILNSVFLPAIGGETGGGAEMDIETPEGETVSTGPSKEKIEEVKMIYLGAAIVQGFGDGVLVGVIEGGKVLPGFRNSFIMVLMAYVILRVVSI